MHEDGYWYTVPAFVDFYAELPGFTNRSRAQGSGAPGDRNPDSDFINLLLTIAALRGVSTCKTLRWDSRFQSYRSYDEFIMHYGWEEGDYKWIQTALDEIGQDAFGTNFVHTIHGDAVNKGHAKMASDYSIRVAACPGHRNTYRVGSPMAAAVANVRRNGLQVTEKHAKNAH